VRPLAILVADEDTDTRIILRTLLERHRFSVTEAVSADSALATAQSSPFDLIILNHPMLSQDGRTLVQCLRSSPVTAACPILNVTSRVVPRFLEQAAVQGVNATLAKPLDVTKLLQAVGELTRTPMVPAV
jgi:two-component system, NarL family, sensor histidine kinase BarA